MCPWANCGQWVKGAMGLRRHITIKHTEGTEGQNGFKCGIDGCTYVATHKQLLNKHKTMNHVPGSFACEICGEFVPTEGAYKKHKRTRHPETRGLGRECTQKVHGRKQEQKPRRRPSQAGKAYTSSYNKVAIQSEDMRTTAQITDGLNSSS